MKIILYEEIGLGLLARWRKMAAASIVSSDKTAAISGGTANKTGQPQAQPVAGNTAAIVISAAGKIAELAEQVRTCTKCSLCKTRKNTVFGTGDTSPGGIMLVGEGPGEQEDIKGAPFVGPAGRLLDAMLASIGVNRGKEIFITNIVKCRPPGNRNPDPIAIASCLPYLERQIELVRPRLLVAAGKIAAQTLLASGSMPMGKLRGKLHRFGNIPLLVIYHPSYFLHSPTEKKHGWTDMLEISKFIRGE